MLEVCGPISSGSEVRAILLIALGICVAVGAINIVAHLLGPLDDEKDNEENGKAMYPQPRRQPTSGDF